MRIWHLWGKLIRVSNSSIIAQKRISIDQWAAQADKSAPYFMSSIKFDYLLLIKVYSLKIKKKMLLLVEATFGNANESKENRVIRDTWVIEHNPRENTFKRNKKTPNPLKIETVKNFNS